MSRLGAVAAVGAFRAHVDLLPVRIRPLEASLSSARAKGGRKARQSAWAQMGLAGADGLQEAVSAPGGAWSAMASSNA